MHKVLDGNLALRGFPTWESCPWTRKLKGKEEEEIFYAPRARNSLVKDKDRHNQGER